MLPRRRRAAQAAPGQACGDPVRGKDDLRRAARRRRPGEARGRHGARARLHQGGAALHRADLPGPWPRHPEHRRSRAG